ncbi:TPM domain-containing protein [Sphingomonas sp. MMS12-HWE2-04]|uniref:TPM domain-containing protein n=1 Tax=Sphingomonas sp. MMS12-HWE2-04 TaxID=3234199 RepID=UPI00384EB27A
MRLTEADQARVSAAVTQAELGTDGEIVTVVAGRSDAYHDVALHWAVLAMLLVLALLAWQPQVVEWLHVRLVDSWSQTVPPRWYLTVALILIAATFLLVRVVLALDKLRMLLTPGATKARRVHARALALFRTAAEKRTKASTGVLLYLSLAEHRAEIIADEAIHSKVAPEVWGEAMAALIAEVKQDRPGEGMAQAVAKVGEVLATHFPRSEGDTNELPDRLIIL